MAFSNLTDRLQGTFKKLRGEAQITEDNIKDSVREVKRALLEADVNFNVVREFVAKTQEKALGEEVLLSVRPGEQFVKIVHDNLQEILGGETATFDLPEERRNVILLLGLQGSGKTTFSAKLSKYWKERELRPMLVACDVYRPAAIEQLKVVGGQVDVPVFSIPGSQDVVEIGRQAMDFARRENRNLIIFDTAGRLHIDEVKMDELIALRDFIKPSYTFLVADAMTGQDAVNSAEAFNSQVGIDGVCLSKLDGDARGGAALSIKNVTGKPIVFASTGEKLDELELFHPDRMASRILGMGDVLTLVETAQKAFDEKQAADAMKMKNRLMRGEFDFEDFLQQMSMIGRMGSLSKIMKMIPGLSGALSDEDLHQGEGELKRVKRIINSMTPKERRNPQLLAGSRKLRIAKGASVEVSEINDLIKQFNTMRKQMSMMMNTPQAKEAFGGGGGSKFTKATKESRDRKKKKKKQQRDQRKKRK